MVIWLKTRMMKRLQSLINNQISVNLCRISDLPVPILHQIFIRIRIKDIMRCKSWLDQLSAPYFSEIYSKDSTFKALLLSGSTTTPWSFHLLEISRNGDCFPTPVDLKLPAFVKESSSSRIIGSCNGFLFIYVSITETKTITMC